MARGYNHPEVDRIWPIRNVSGFFQRSHSIYIEYGFYSTLILVCILYNVVIHIYFSCLCLYCCLYLYCIIFRNHVYLLQHGMFSYRTWNTGRLGCFAFVYLQGPSLEDLGLKLQNPEAEPETSTQVLRQVDFVQTLSFTCWWVLEGIVQLVSVMYVPRWAGCRGLTHPLDDQVAICCWF